jgi:lipopolysaccharide biosynthesis regulator YciM
MFPEFLAALSESQRTLAHVVVLLVLPVAAALVYLIRRRVRRRDQNHESQRIPEEER